MVATLVCTGPSVLAIMIDLPGPDKLAVWLSGLGDCTA